MGKGRILIAGAGVAGLSAALELAARGWTVAVFEKAAALSEIGAGMQLAPNAMRHLERLGVAPLIGTAGVTPETLAMMDGRRARPLMLMPLGDRARQRWHHPYIVCHRADLQSALLQACRSNPAIEIALGAEIQSHRSAGETVVATVRREAGNETVRGDYLVACDGVWSAQRAASGCGKARFSGHIAWRTTLAAAALPASFIEAVPERTAVSAWLGPKAHFIAYPVKGGAFFNFVAITAGDNPGEVWSKAGERERLAAAYSGWGRPVRDVLSAAPQWTCWPLFEMAEARFLGKDGTILIGDAAHALTPFAAQGAAMAIEDAAALAEALDGTNGAAALAYFETVRKGRIAAVAKRGKLNRFAYHAAGPLALGRNMLFALRGPEQFLKDLDWLYGYDAVAAMRR